MKRSLLSTPKFWITCIFAAGIFYLCALQLLVSDGVYFTGDAGLKALLTQNLAAGNFGFDIKFPDPAWVKALWEQGLFPHQPPYVYEIAGKYFITFPYIFSLVTAPFYVLFGYRGLYLVPWLATVGIWVVFYLFCKKLDLSPLSIGVGLLVLIFSTHLPLYSAMYGEHTIAVLLSLAGLYWLFPKKDLSTLRLRDACWGGVFSALAVWFRPEQILLVIFLGIIWAGSLINRIRPSLMRSLHLEKIFAYIGKSGWIYMLSSFLTLCLYGLTNWVVYHNFLGVHLIEIVDSRSLVERFLTFLGNLRLLTVGYYSFFLYFPIALILLAYFLYAWIKPGQDKTGRNGAIFYVFCLFFIMGVALLVPGGAGGRQWGPRFLLFLVPLGVLLFAWQLDPVLRVPVKTFGKMGRIGLGLVIIAGGVGIIQNPIRGSAFLMQTYSQDKSAVADLRRAGEPVVAISDQFLAQLFQPAVSRSIIFLEVTSEEDLAKFSEALAAQSLHRFSYICYSFDCKLFELNQKSKQVERNGTAYYLEIVDAREEGIYIVFDLIIKPGEVQITNMSSLSLVR